MIHYERDIEVNSFEDYLDCWDFLSMDLITDKFWNENYEFIKSMTFDLYQVEKNLGEINLKLSAKRLEIIFSNLFKYGIIS
jgi:hypothetical protein